MTRSTGFFALPLLALVAVFLDFPSTASAQEMEAVLIRIDTEVGSVHAELYPDRAPITVENFLRYVDTGLFENGQFHRTVREDNQPNDSIKIAVIQGGIDPARRQEGFGQIVLERTNLTGLRHLDGTLSMARGGPDTAISDFFVCIGDQPELDFGGKRNPDGQGFAAFGRVTEGMEVVRLIQQRNANARQRLDPPVRILNIVRLVR